MQNHDWYVYGVLSIIRRGVFFLICTMHHVDTVFGSPYCDDKKITAMMYVINGQTCGSIFAIFTSVLQCEMDAGCFRVWNLSSDFFGDVIKR